MTICIAVHFGEFIALAADTRTSLGRPTISFKDGTEKIHETAIGLVTGSGWVELLDPVRKRLLNETLTHSNKILEIIKDEISAADEYYMYATEEIINSTGWIYTYASIEHNEPCIRLGLYHGSISRELTESQYLIPKGGACVWIDAQFSENSSIHYSRYLTDKLEAICKIKDIEKKFDSFIEQCTNLVSYASHRYDSVSAEFNIGLHFINGDKVIKGPFSVESGPSREIEEYISSLEQQET